MRELDNVQGLVFSGYARLPFSRYFFVRFGQGDARGFLGALVNRVSSAARDERDEERRLNLALTASGLSGLGLDEESLATFAPELVEGMEHPERAAALGDVGADAPATWEIGGAGTPLDALVLCYGESLAELDEEAEAVSELLERYDVEARAEDAYLPADGRSHFGFADVRSNPRFQRFSLARRHAFDKGVPLGEFLLGHANARGVRQEGPRAPSKVATRELPPLLDQGRTMDLGKNGSYLVLRKLEEDVLGFRSFLAEQGERAFPELGARASERLLASLVGRWPNGAPLVLAPEAPPAGAVPPNDFGYRDVDPEGLRCPLGAHVRRANPRDDLEGEGDAAASLRRMRSHRLLRRGRLYGPRTPPSAGDAPRGLYFMALCTSFSRQFEFVRESLLENPKYHGLYDERDPLVGRRRPTDAEPDGFSIQCEPYAKRIPMQRFVRVRGGAYLFLPSLRALAYLAEP